MTLKMIAIVGPTASGKTELGIQLAETFDGEIVSADSRTIYRHTDIGTAKPSVVSQVRIRHHLLDLLEPDETLTVGVFKVLAEQAIADIAGRSKVPIIVGGSGLYMDAVLYDYSFPGESRKAQREQFDSMNDVDLLELLKTRDPEAYERVDTSNRRRVTRALETVGQARSKAVSVRDDTLVIGIATSKEVIHARIEERIDNMLDNGFLAEVKKIGETYGWDSALMNVTGYRAMKGVVLGTKSLEEGVKNVVRDHMALYKKQMTWFKRNTEIKWLDSVEQAEPMVREFLAR